VHELLFPALNFGVTDRLTIGGGISLFPCSGECSQFGYVTPKLGLYSSENVQVATGVAVVTGLGDLDGTGGIVYGVSTFGSPDNSVSVGAGYGFSSDDVFDQPLAMLGGDFRFARRASFVTENYLVPFGDNGDYTLVVSYGVRLFGDRLSVDLGFFNLIEEPLFPGLPLLGFAFHF